MLNEDIQVFALECIGLARKLGVIPSNPIAIYINAHDAEGSPILRKLILSYEQPGYPVDDEIFLWFNPATWNFYKTTNWKSPSTSWEQQTTWQELFDETTVTLDGGQLTSPLYLFEDPVTPDEAATRRFVLDAIAAGGGGGGGSAYYGDPVVDIAALQALNVSLAPDGKVVLVRSINALFSYNSTSTATPDGLTVVQPTIGSGRWLNTESSGASNSIDLDNGSLSSGALTTSSIGTYALDSVLIADIRSLEYVIQGQSGTDFQLMKVLIIHNGSTPFIMEYGDIQTGLTLFTIDAAIASGTLTLNLTVVNAVGEYKFMRTVLNT